HSLRRIVTIVREELFFFVIFLLDKNYSFHFVLSKWSKPPDKTDSQSILNYIHSTLKTDNNKCPFG
ncbi:MAG: hypothetical protein WC437_03225, partial [Patescibacteria group bacterium]